VTNTQTAAPSWAGSVISNYRQQFRARCGVDSALSDLAIFAITDSVFDDSDSEKQDEARVLEMLRVEAEHHWPDLSAVREAARANLDAAATGGWLDEVSRAAPLETARDMLERCADVEKLVIDAEIGGLDLVPLMTAVLAEFVDEWRHDRQQQQQQKEKTDAK
jgi:hypothetical protein